MAECVVRYENVIHSFDFYSWVAEGALCAGILNSSLPDELLTVVNNDIQNPF